MLELGIEITIINEFLQQISSSKPVQLLSTEEVPNVSTAVSAPPTFNLSQDTSPSIEKAQLSQELLKMILLDILGPMADSIYRELSAVPSVNQQALRILERLHELELGEELIQDIEIRLKPFLVS